ncbi:MAG TPA: DUF1828 domain-containing protein [Gemmataceae bacterium]|nr:DUF1828 domain-containing protein [Gemmataceae bacterium]
MNIDCANVKELVGRFSLVRDCETLDDGTLRIATAFHYPDGSLIDVFLKEEAPPPEDREASWIRGYLLSDFGQTMTYLMDMGVRPSSSERKKRIVDDICTSTGVEYRRGELQVWIDPRDTAAVGTGIAQLVLACVRSADLSFFQKYPSAKPFQEEVKEFIGRDRIEESPGALAGQWGRQVEVDFIVRGRKRRSLVKTVSTGGMASSIHPYLTEAFARWYDLKPVHAKDQMVTVIDEREHTGRPDDLRRLETLSEVVVFPRDRELLRQILAAA